MEDWYWCEQCGQWIVEPDEDRLDTDDEMIYYLCHQCAAPVVHEDEMEF